MRGDPPICPNCKRPTIPAGGIILQPIYFWKCFDCGYEVEDLPHETIEPNNLLTQHEKQD